MSQIIRHLIVLIPLITGVIGVIGIINESDWQGYTTKPKRYPPHTDDYSYYVKLRSNSRSTWLTLQASRKVPFLCLTWNTVETDSRSSISIEIKYKDGKTGIYRKPLISEVKNNSVTIFKYRFLTKHKPATIVFGHTFRRTWCGLRDYHVINPVPPSRQNLTFKEVLDQTFGSP